MNKLPLLERFHSRLIALERRAPLTAETYRTEIRKFLDWLEKEKLCMEDGLSARDLGSYLAFRRKVDKLDSRSIAKAISALRSFFRFLEDEGHGAYINIADDLESPRQKDRLPLFHNKEDVELLLSKINVKSPLGIRNRAIYELMYSGGLRISEVVSLKITDVFIDKQLARVHGKGNKERLVIFGPEAAYWLKSYLNESRPLLLKARLSRVLFVNKNGDKLSRKGIWKNYSKLAKEAAIITKPHALRHSFATELLKGGADLRSVQELLGHAEIVTTQIYTHVDQGRLRDSHKKYLPTLKNYRAVNDVQ